MHKIELNKPKQKFEDIESNKNLEIYSKEKLGEQSSITKNNNNNHNDSSARQQILKMRRPSKTTTKRSNKNNAINLKEQDIVKEKNESNDMKMSSDENKNIIGLYKVANEHIDSFNDTIYSIENELKNVYINNWLICCFWFTSRKRNINKILFEEGSKILTERLDILNMFNHLYIIEKIQKKLSIDFKGISMSNRCVTNLQIYNINNKKT